MVLEFSYPLFFTCVLRPQCKLEKTSDLTPEIKPFIQDMIYEDEKYYEICDGDVGAFKSLNKSSGDASSKLCMTKNKLPPIESTAHKTTNLKSKARANRISKIPRLPILKLKKDFSQNLEQKYTNKPEVSALQDMQYYNKRGALIEMNEQTNKEHLKNQPKRKDVNINAYSKPILTEANLEQYKSYDISSLVKYMYSFVKNEVIVAVGCLYESRFRDGHLPDVLMKFTSLSENLDAGAIVKVLDIDYCETPFTDDEYDDYVLVRSDSIFYYSVAYRNEGESIEKDKFFESTAELLKVTSSVSNKIVTKSISVSKLFPIPATTKPSRSFTAKAQSSTMMVTSGNDLFAGGLKEELVEEEGDKLEKRLIRPKPYRMYLRSKEPALSRHFLPMCFNKRMPWPFGKPLEDQKQLKLLVAPIPPVKLFSQDLNNVNFALKRHYNSFCLTEEKELNKPAFKK